MLAGVGGIDLVILVVAADESIKPQTREHFDICRMLNIRRGLTVLTKADLVDADTLEVVRLEVEEFLRGSFLDPQPRRSSLSAPPPAPDSNGSGKSWRGLPTAHRRATPGPLSACPSIACSASRDSARWSPER